MVTKNYWARLQKQRISRRRLIGTAGTGAAGLAVVAACGGGGGDEPPRETPAGLAPTGTPVAEAKPVYGGRFQAANNAVFDGLDPHLTLGSATTYFPRIYNVLLKQSASRPEFIYNDLAEEYEAPDPGGTEWIFHIRSGVKIAPNQLGVPERDLDADDARISFERIKSLPDSGANAFVGPWFESTQAPDPQTFIIKTPTPYAWFLVNIGGTQYWSTIPPRELIEQDPDRMKTNAVGGGPFSVVGYSEAEFLTLDKNPNYYRTDPANGDAQLPYIDGWDVKVLPDIAALRVAFESQQTYSYTPKNRAEADDLLSQQDVWSGDPSPVFSFISFVMNVTRGPWGDPKVRKAAMHATNRQQYIDLVYGGEAQANGIVHWPVGAYALPPDELEDLQPFNPELSKQLIQEAGYDLPLKIKVIFPSGGFLELDEHLAIFVEQMNAAGFEVEVEAQEIGGWIESMNATDYDATLSPNRADETPEFPLDFHHSQGPSANGLFSKGLQNPDVDAAIEATKQITDSEELVAAIQEVQRLIYDIGPMYLPIVSSFSRVLYWNFVKNFPTDLGNAGQLLNTWWLEGAPN